MAAQSNLKNMAICLTAVCLLCSAILAAIYAVTFDPIEKAKKDTLIQALSLVLPAEGEINTDAQYVGMDGRTYEYYVQTVDGEPVCWAIKSVTDGFGGPLTVMVGMEKDGIVHAAKVLEHSETPGLGAKCQSDEHFISQFAGFSAASGTLKVRKDGGDIDAITASTITSRAYTLAVENAVKVAAQLQTVKPVEEEQNNE